MLSPEIKWLGHEADQSPSTSDEVREKCSYTSTLPTCSLVTTGTTVLHFIITYQSRLRGWDSSVGIATRYGLEGPGIESRWGARYSAPVQTGPGVKRPGRGIDHPPPFSAKVKEGVELDLYSPSAPSWPVLGWTLPLTFTDHDYRPPSSLGMKTEEKLTCQFVVSH